MTARFVIRKDGSLTDIEILDSPDKLLSDAVIDVLGRSPKWEPGVQNGLAVDVRLTMPIEFRLMENNTKNGIGRLFKIFKK